MSGMRHLSTEVFDMQFVKKVVNNLKVIAVFTVLFAFFSVTVYRMVTQENLNFSGKGKTAAEKIDTFSAELESAWNRLFPVQDELIAAAVKFQYYLTGEFSSAQVVQGEDNWLFYKATDDGDPIADYSGTNCFSEQSMTTITDAMLKSQKVLQEKGIEFCVLVPPNKENVYSCFMPENYEKAEVTRTDRLIAALQDAGVHAVHPKEELIKHSKNYNTYYKYDTHWNELGAYIATRQVMDLWGISVDEATKDNVISVSKTYQDLAKMVGIQDIFNDDKGMTVAGLYDGIDWEAFASEQLAGASHLHNPEARFDKTLLLVGDSFRDAMVPTVCMYFEDVYVTHRYFYKQSMIDEYDPDYMIVEYVERYSDQITAPVA